MLEPHVDTEPDWAGGRGYAAILGIALSPARAANRGLVVWPFHGDKPELPDLEAGDVSPCARSAARERPKPSAATWATS